MSPVPASNLEQRFRAVARRCVCVAVLVGCAPLLAQQTDPETGLAKEPGIDAVKANCTACHSAMLITQSRATREGWLAMIRWMQETQRLWPLGEQEDAILDYLAKNYGPSFRGRRPPLPASLMPGPH